MAQRIVIAGASGLIGTALAEMSAREGDRVIRLVRREPRGRDEVRWDPQRRVLDPAVLAGADAAVSLNGASVGRLPWTARYRRELVRSRIDSTETIVEALIALGDEAPRLVSGSAVGYYGSAPGETLTESSPSGETFLARLSQRWEAAARRAEPVTGVALVRTAPVIHRAGVLRPMLTVTKLGLGGPLGSGAQIWPWISLTDEVRAIRFVIERAITGAVNLTGPTPASQGEIGRAIARAERRPFWLPAPSWALRGALGPAADSLLLTDADVRPRVLSDAGFRFTHETADEAVRAALGS